MAPAGGIDGGAVGALRTAASRATGVEYDCALLNKYPDGASAMRYHSDPDHGAQTWGTRRRVARDARAKRALSRRRRV